MNKLLKNHSFLTSIFYYNKLTVVDISLLSNYTCLIRLMHPLKQTYMPSFLATDFGIASLCMAMPMVWSFTYASEA